MICIILGPYDKVSPVESESTAVWLALYAIRGSSTKLRLICSIFASMLLITQSFGVKSQPNMYIFYSLYKRIVMKSYTVHHKC